MHFELWRYLSNGERHLVALRNEVVNLTVGPSD